MKYFALPTLFVVETTVKQNGVTIERKASTEDAMAIHGLDIVGPLGYIRDADFARKICNLLNESETNAEKVGQTTGEGHTSAVRG